MHVSSGLAANDLFFFFFFLCCGCYFHFLGFTDLDNFCFYWTASANTNYTLTFLFPFLSTSPLCGSRYHIFLSMVLFLLPQTTAPFSSLF